MNKIDFTKIGYMPSEHLESQNTLRTIIYPLPFLHGKKWGPLAFNYIMALRPSSIYVSDGGTKADARSWRVTVMLAEDKKTIEYIYQEVDVACQGFDSISTEQMDVLAGNCEPDGDLIEDDEQIQSLVNYIYEFAFEWARLQETDLTNEQKFERIGQKIQLPEQVAKKYLLDVLSKSDNPFIMPSDDDLLGIAILFNDGKLDEEKLTDMVACSQFIVERLYENRDIKIPSKREAEYIIDEIDNSGNNENEGDKSESDSKTPN